MQVLFFIFLFLNNLWQTPFCDSCESNCRSVIGRPFCCVCCAEQGEPRRGEAQRGAVGRGEVGWEGGGCRTYVCSHNPPRPTVCRGVGGVGREGRGGAGTRAHLPQRSAFWGASKSSSWRGVAWPARGKSLGSHSSQARRLAGCRQRLSRTRASARITPDASDSI